MHEADQDGDGALFFEEYQEWAKKQKSFEEWKQEAQKLDPLANETELQGIFDEADADNTNVLGTEE